MYRKISMHEAYEPSNIAKITDLSQNTQKERWWKTHFRQT